MTTTRMDLAGVLRVAADHAVDSDREARFPHEAVAALRESGLLGSLVPREFGGRGDSVADMAETTIAIGRTCTSTAMIFAMHCQQSAALVRHGSPDLQTQVLPEISAGALYLASVTTEQTTGGHLLTSDATSDTADEHVLIDRFAPVCTGGAEADSFLISVRTPGAERADDVTLVYATRDQLVVEPRGEWTPVGMRGTDSGPLQLRGAVPARQIVGGFGGFRDIVVRTFAPIGHIGWAAAWLGAADGAFERVVRHLRRRGSSLTDIDRERLSRIRMRSDSTHALLSRVVDLYDKEPARVGNVTSQLLINGLKVVASEQTRAMVDELITVVGMRHGYMTDSPLGLERVWRDLRSAPLNYSNDRLVQANGTLLLMDPEVTHV